MKIKKNSCNSLLLAARLVADVMIGFGVCLTGCQSSGTICQPATPKSSKPLPTPELKLKYEKRTPLSPLPKAELIGKWTCTFENASVIDIVDVKKLFRETKRHQWEEHWEFELYEDGVYRLNKILGVDFGRWQDHGHVEQQSSGTYDYLGGHLTFHEKNAKGESLDSHYSILNYGNGQFELRTEDVGELKEKLFASTPVITSFQMSVEDDGCWVQHVYYQLGQKGADVYVQHDHAVHAPRIFKRVSEDGSEMN